MSTWKVDSLPIAASPRSDQQADSIDSWLAVLVRLLDVSASQRDSIRDEIEGHLRERVRDLMIAGTSEPDAIRTAISELGEVADLARRFSHASRSKTRRTLMNAAVLAFGAISVATATVFINGPQPTRPVMTVFESQPTAAPSDASRVLDDRKIDVNFIDQQLGEVFEHVASEAGLDLVVHERDLENSGLSIDESVSLQLRDQPISQILRHVADQCDPSFAWRVSDGVLEVATLSVFDRREIVLASFDVRSILDLIWQHAESMDEATSRLESLVLEYVEPAAWISNGGDLASLRIVGGKMFVKAPARFHQPIEWILAQLEESAEAQAQSRTGASPVGDFEARSPHAGGQAVSAIPSRSAAPAGNFLHSPSAVPPVSRPGESSTPAPEPPSAGGGAGPAVPPVAPPTSSGGGGSAEPAEAGGGC